MTYGERRYVREEARSAFDIGAAVLCEKMGYVTCLSIFRLFR